MFRLCFLHFVVLLFGLSAQAKSLNQQLFEEINKIKCQEASPQEIQTLRCQLTPAEQRTRDLDKLAESIVFTDISKCELGKLGCLERELQFILLLGRLKRF